MRLRDFQVLKSRRWLPGQIWVRGKSSGGSTCTVPRKLFRDFNLLCIILHIQASSFRYTEDNAETHIALWNIIRLIYLSIPSKEKVRGFAEYF
jgi:hypothetical protein